MQVNLEKYADLRIKYKFLHQIPLVLQRFAVILDLVVKNMMIFLRLAFIIYVNLVQNSKFGTKVLIYTKVHKTP